MDISMTLLRRSCIAFGFLGASAGMVAIAAEQTIHQKGRVFSQEAITIKQGESLVFLNDDSVPHNVMSTSAGNEFNLGSVAPGTSVPVTFDKAGTATVICAIHPRMKMTVTVN
jgi:plastocyanin